MFALAHRVCTQFAAAAICLAASAAGQTTTLFVDATAQSPTWPYDGGWNQAAPTIQQAIDAAATLAQGETHILVAHGVYTPSGLWGGFGPADKAIVLDSPTSGDYLHLHGGFKGYNGGSSGTTDWWAPDGGFNKTKIKGIDAGTPLNNSIVADASGSSSFNGKFTIDGFKVHKGGRGALLLDCQDGLIENVNFRENTVINKDGGAVIAHNLSGSDSDRVIMRFCRFEENDAREGGALSVPGYQGTFAVVNCEFRANGTENTRRGGAVYLDEGGNGSDMVNSFFIAQNCVFEGNIAGKVDTSDPVPTGQGGAVFYRPGNWVHTTGGKAVSHRWAHCTFARNSGATHTSTGGVYIFEGSVFQGWSRNVYFDNTIFWQNTGLDLAIVNNTYSGPTVSTNYCNFTSTSSYYDPLGNNTFAPTTPPMTQDPLFVNLAGGNLRLSTPDPLQPGSASPCIDAGLDAITPNDVADIDDDGNPNPPGQNPLPLDLDLANRVFDHPGIGGYPGAPGNPVTTVDIGAYENTSAVPPGGQ